MLDLKKVAITGGLSCGKSSVCLIFKELGAYVVSADEIVHNILSCADTPIGKKIILLLGNDIIKNGTFDRQAIASKVFQNREHLHSLQNLLHPIVLSEIEKNYKKAVLKGDTKLFVAEVPLLFEGNHKKFFDFVITVYADPKICTERFIKSTGYTSEDYKNRMANQLPVEEKIKFSDAVIHNSGDFEQLYQTVKTLFTKLNSLE